MIKNVLEHIGGIANYGIISLCLFFAVFAGVLVWAFRLKKPTSNAAARCRSSDDATQTHPETLASLDSP